MAMGLGKKWEKQSRKKTPQIVNPQGSVFELIPVN